MVGLPSDTRNTLLFSCAPATGLMTVTGKPEARNVVLALTPPTGGQDKIRRDCRTAPEF